MYNITNITSKNVYFQDGRPTVNYVTKGYKRSIEGLHLGYTKKISIMKIELLEAEISEVLCHITSKNLIFQDGGQTVNYGTKWYKSSIEDPHLRYTKTETW